MTTSKITGRNCQPNAEDVFRRQPRELHGDAGAGQRGDCGV